MLNSFKIQTPKGWSLDRPFAFPYLYLMPEKRRYIIEPVTEEEKILKDMQLPKEQRILKLLRLIRYSNIVAEAGAKHKTQRF